MCTYAHVQDLYICIYIWFYPINGSGSHSLLPDCFLDTGMSAFYDYFISLRVNCFNFLIRLSYVLLFSLQMQLKVPFGCSKFNFLCVQHSQGSGDFSLYLHSDGAFFWRRDWKNSEWGMTALFQRPSSSMIKFPFLLHGSTLRKLVLTRYMEFGNKLNLSPGKGWFPPVSSAGVEQG